MRKNIEQNKLEQIILTHFPEETPPYHFKRIPTGRFNDSFFVSTDSRELVLRIAPPQNTGLIFYEKNMMAQEPGLHKIIREQTDIPVPDIYVYDTSHSVIDSDYLIMEKIDGTAATDASFLSQEQWDKVLYQVGGYLRELHSITGRKYGYLGEHHPMEPQRDWGSAFGIMWEKLVNQIMEVEGYSKEEGDFFLKLLDNAKEIFRHNPPSSLLHMDVWHQNIIVDESGSVTGIIDWDRALWGDVEIEFAVLDYCGISEPAFWEGYGIKRDFSYEAQIRNVFYLLYEIQKYIIIYATRRHNPSTMEQYRNHAFALAQKLME